MYLAREVSNHCRIFCDLLYLRILKYTPLFVRPVALAAASATVISATIIFAAMMTDLSEKEEAQHDEPTFLSLSLAFGTIVFSFGGISAFPTIQNDMQHPQKFPTSVMIAYFGKFCCDVK